MTALMNRFRGPLIALVVLVFTAGVAFAGGGPPPAADHGLQTAAEAAGKTVPVRAGQADDEVEEETPVEEVEEVEEVDETTETEELEDAAHCTDVEPTNHGALVCWAAQNAPETWDGTHGEWVSCVARLSNNGHAVEPEEGETVEPIVWADMTSEACGEAIEAAREAKAAERAEAKAEREATRAARAADREAARAEGAGSRGGKGKGGNR